LLAEGGNRVALDIESGGITVAASNDTGKSVEHVEAEVTGEDVKVLLNSNYIQDGIKAVGAELLDIAFHGPNGPCIFIQNGYRYLVLPFRTERK
jgi:DNA polymerase III sliding clamp (beta) subunit (PCNA family)